MVCSEDLLIYFTLIHFGICLPSERPPINHVPTPLTSVFPVFTGQESQNKMGVKRLLTLDRTLYIGARDSIYTIDLDKSGAESITGGETASWTASDSDIESCKEMGGTEDDCANFIKVLLKRNDDTLFVCGTNAFNPTCRNYKKDTLEPEDDTISGVGKCPYKPNDENAALFSGLLEAMPCKPCRICMQLSSIADDDMKNSRKTLYSILKGDELYTATVSDFMGVDPVIYRSLGNYPKLRTVKQDSRWLKDPQFIDSFEYGDYVYFFFQEESVEYQPVEKVILPRIARVCKNDMGGTMAVLDKHWTSFLKTRLICAVHEDTTFYFNNIQAVSHVMHMDGSDLFLALFSTPKNSIPASAICSFDIVDINQAFFGQFKEQLSSTSVWTIVPDNSIPSPRPGSCAGRGSHEQYTSSTEFPEESLQFMRTHVLMAEPGEPHTKHPWFLWTVERDFLVALAVDNSAGPKEDHTVVYAASQNGVLLKILARNHGKGFTEDSIFLEEMNIFDSEKCAQNNKEDKKILALQVDKPSGALYVAFPNCVIRVPLGSCERHGPCKKACIASRDPYCGWANEACVYLSPGTTIEYEQDIENGNTENLEDC